MTHAFDGIRVLDFTQLEQGPSGTQVLADFGAEVIKIERIDTGEIGRRQWPTMDQDYSPHWSAVNRNKKSLTVDVKSDRGRELVLELARSADIVASNFRPGVMDRLGLGYEALSEVNERIIVAYASGYGQDGPGAARRGQDLAAQAMGGLMHLTGTKEGGPVPTGTFIVDYIASMQFALGMSIALAARERTGRGQLVDCSLLNASISSHLQEATAFLNTGHQYGRATRHVAHVYNTALYGYYECRGGDWLALVGEFYVSEPWRRLARALDLPDHVRDDPRYQCVEGLRDHLEETRDLVAAALITLEREEAIARFDAEDLLAAPVNDYEQVFADEQVQHNEMAIWHDVPGQGRRAFVGFPIKLEDTPASFRCPPPMVGQHNEETLVGLGYSPAEIEQLRSQGVLGAESTQRARDQGPWW